jgi:hypothetical protein
MPGYGLPAGTKGLLRWNWARERLVQSHNYWLSTVRPDGAPHTMIVWGVWLDGRFYFSTGRLSRKARNLAANRQCVVCTEQADEAVIVEGAASEVREAAARRKFLRVYEKKYDWDMSELENEPVFALSPRVAFGLIEKDSLSTATRWRFEKSRKGSNRKEKR